MRIISMFLSPVLFLLFSSVLCGASAVTPVPTYEHLDPSTGETLICEKCPPGEHMTAHCTANTRTQCDPCKADHFTELWNYLPRCLYCNNFCYENQEVEKECSAKSNRVCRCKEGFYWSDDFCIRHSECGHGSGVKTKGTSRTNTVCEQCPDGYFSNSSSALSPCVNHHECASGRTVFLSGTAYQDTLCGTCDDVADGGEAYRTFLSEFFRMHRMRVPKMKKFVSSNIRRLEEARCIRGATRKRGPLQDQIRAWLLEAPNEQLQNLPEMLRAAQLTSMAEKLEKFKTSACHVR